MRIRLIKLLAGAILALGVWVAASASPALAAEGPGWSISAIAQPSRFSAADAVRCEETSRELCDSYTLTVTNAGSAASNGTPVTITDTLPEAVTIEKVIPPLGGGAENRGVDVESQEAFECTVSTHEVTCTDAEPVPAEDMLQVRIYVALVAGASGDLVNHAQVEGGGAPAAETVSETAIGESPPFGVEDFSFQALDAEGASDGQAAGHPYAVTTSFNFASRLKVGSGAEAGGAYEPVAQGPRDVVVTLPLGFLGDPLATSQRCSQADLINGTGKLQATCPAASEVGTVAVDTEGKEEVGIDPKTLISPVYNLVPEKGYPAELGFDYLGQGITMYASVVPVDGSYGLRVALPGIPRAYLVDGASLTIWGTPADPSHDSQRYRVNADGVEERDIPAEGPAEAFLTNPVDCGATGLTATIEADSWEEPGRWTAPVQSPAYLSLSNCDMLQFQPRLEAQPETTRADEPSGYTVNLEVPQAPDLSSLLATPELKNATVTLPEGVSVSPSAADGLAACQASGPQGINIPTDAIGPAGEDLADPEATELGEGHAGGDGSAYDDGLYHIAPGHCPGASRIGAVKIVTPLLPEPLEGSVYLAQPAKCAIGQAESECSEAAAEDGEVFGIYLEAAGSGVIVKLKGRVEAGGYGAHSAATGLKPGQLRTTFAENPQLPFSDLKLSFNSGARAPLANPQSCGTATTTSVLEPWGGPTATPYSSFAVPCEGMPFDPSFTAQMQTPIAGGYSPFSLTFARSDGQQDLSRITVKTPPGLVGLLSRVTLCGEPQASEGKCPASSQIGTATVASGPGSHPYWLSGPVYITGPYGGGPFGLSIPVVAEGGPFDLGTVVTRAAIDVDPHTAALTVVSEPLPQIRDGVPLRLQTVNVTIDQAGQAGNQFMLNPTNCAQQQISASIGGLEGYTASHGSTVQVATPFAVTGCAGLPFKPGFSAETHARHTRKTGAYFKVDVSSNEGEANIKEVKVTLPKKLPSVLATLNLACTEAQFAANPGDCPKESFVGTATAHTPALSKELTGPAIFVSHGHAKFPNLDIVLQGEGVTVILEGETFINKSGYTISTFGTVPDVPISSFQLTLPREEHPALTGEGNLCQKALDMPTTIIGQNGALIEKTTQVEVAGCATKLSVASHKVTRRTATIKVYVPAAGRVKASGKGLRAQTKTAKGRGTLTFKLKQKKAGKLKTKVKLLFKPSKGKKQSKKVTLKFRR